MRRSAMLVPNLTIGLDLGDRVSRICEVDAAGRVVNRASISTNNPVMIEGYFAKREACRMVLEVGTHSPWVSRRLEALGHEVVVANPRAVYGTRRRRKRNDDMDAEFLARQGRADPSLLHPIRHRGPDAQAHLALLRSRDQLVRARTKLINHVRGSVKSLGGRLPKGGAEAFPRRAMQAMPQELKLAMEPLLEMVTELTQRIRAMDHRIQKVIEAQYPEARRLQRIPGVGPVTSLAFVLLIEDPYRFERSREVGAYFGLVPKLDESSESRPQLRITKSGDGLGRRLLVSSAHYILGPHGPECDLRTHGHKLAEMRSAPRGVSTRSNRSTNHGIAPENLPTRYACCFAAERCEHPPGWLATVKESMPAVSAALPFSPLGRVFGFAPFPGSFFVALGASSPPTRSRRSW